MRHLALLSIALIWASGQAQLLVDYEAQGYLDTLKAQDDVLGRLLKRQACASNYKQCTAISAPGSCCPNDTDCARDQNGNAACCPSGNVCTGAVSGTATRTASTSTTPFVLGGTTQTSATITASAPLASGYSTLSNAYYPFLVIPTTYANQQDCLSAYSSCQSASTACFSSLAGQNGVTISGVGSQGITQAGASGTIAQSAQSICSTLYQSGCYNIQTSVCTNFASGGSTQSTGFIQAGAAPTRRTGAMYTAAAAAAVAGAGMAGLGVI